MSVCRLSWSSVINCVNEWKLQTCDLCRAMANSRTCVVNAKFAVNSEILLVSSPQWDLVVQRRSWRWSDVSVNGQT